MIGCVLAVEVEFLVPSLAAVVELRRVTGTVLTVEL